MKPGSQAEGRKVRLRGALPPGQLHSGASCECEAILAEAGDVIVFDGIWCMRAAEFGVGHPVRAVLPHAVGVSA